MSQQQSFALTDTRIEFEPEWHKDLLSGHRKAFGWGISGDIYYYLMQTPYLLVGLIDGMQGPLVGQSFAGLPVYTPEVLKQYHPDEVVIIIFSDFRQFGAQIRAQIAAIGDFCVQTPYLAARDDRLWQVAPHWPKRLATIMSEWRTRPMNYQPLRKITLWIHALVKGGAERQIVLLALGLRCLGWQVQLICSHTTNSQDNHWVELLKNAGIELIFLPSQRDIWPQLSEATEYRELAMLLAPYFESGLLHNIVTTQAQIRSFNPQVLVCYLDDGNVCAAMAAMLCGVEHILVAGRNVAPPLLPGITCYDEERLSEFYKQFMSLPGCVLFNNSEAGAQSYARWLDLDQACIPVIKNAVMVPQEEGPAVDIRQLLGLPASARVILGAMRFSPEKSPEAFVQVVADVIHQEPDVYAVLLGKGDLEPILRQKIAELNLTQRILLPGVRDDIFSWLQQATVLLSTSRFEGMSNIILEAQSAGCPVVATDIPGNRETLLPSLVEMGCLIPYGQWEQISARLLLLLKHPDHGLAEQLRQEMQRHYSPQRLAEQTLALCSL